MVKQLDRERLKPGVSRQCQANRHCAMEGPSFAIPVVSIGKPHGQMTIDCEVCGIFACGGCAKRDALRLWLGNSEVFAWRLMCPLCGSLLGDPQPGKAILHSAQFGALAMLDTATVSWQLDKSTRASRAIEQALTYHNEKALRLLYAFITQLSVAGAIRFAELAVEESPGEGVAWLYKGLLCGKAGYGIARWHALTELGALVDGNGDQRPGHAALRHLQLKPEWRPDDGPLKDISNRLAEYDEQLVKDAETLFNPELARYHRFIRSYWNTDIRLSDVIAQLFAEESQMTPVVRTFMAGRQMEENVDLQMVESERTSFITVMAHVLDQDELSQLVAKTIAQRLGSIGLNDYYLQLRELAVTHKVDLAEFPALESYFQYCALVNSIEPEVFHGDLWDRIRLGYRERIKTDAERCLVEDACRVFLIRRLFDYCQNRLGVARIPGTYAPHPSAVKDLAKSLKTTAEKPKETFWQRLFPVHRLWRRLFH